MTTVNRNYSLEGRSLAACSCGTCSCSPCDCNSVFDSFVAYHIERGQIEGQDVSGVTLVKALYIPGTTKIDTCHTVIYIDAKATVVQRKAVLKAFNGELGGALADLASLAEVADVRVVPIEYSSVQGRDSIQIDTILGAKPTQSVTPSWKYSYQNSSQNTFCFAA